MSKVDTYMCVIHLLFDRLKTNDMASLTLSNSVDVMEDMTNSVIMTLVSTFSVITMITIQ